MWISVGVQQIAAIRGHSGHLLFCRQRAEHGSRCDVHLDDLPLSGTPARADETPQVLHPLSFEASILFEELPSQPGERGGWQKRRDQEQSRQAEEPAQAGRVGHRPGSIISGRSSGLCHGRHQPRGRHLPESTNSFQPRVAKNEAGRAGGQQR